MKAHLERYNAFIEEQVSWFNLHLSTDFSHHWNDAVWACGVKGTGWLRGNGSLSLRFDEIKRLKGVSEQYIVSDDYCQFMKAMLVVLYRGKNSNMSPAVAMATLMILKRWYHALVYLTGQNHPVYLTTTVIEEAMSILSSSSKLDDPNVSNYKGRCVSLQKIVNHQAFTLVVLDYVSDSKYTNRTNLTRKAREAIDMKEQEYLDDNSSNELDKLISIRGFLNIVSLINVIKNDAEKISLNCLLLLIVTGFRSVEAFNLRCDALVKRQVDDENIRSRLKKKGLPTYFLGIKYVGVKGAGERTHWVEPLAVPLVENIFSAVNEITKPMRSHLSFLRSKSFIDYLPRTVTSVPGSLIELDEVVTYIAQTSSSSRGRAGMRDKAAKALAKRGVIPEKVKIEPKNSKSIYFSKNDLSNFVKSEFNANEFSTPCTLSWKENGKKYTVNYEDLLFLHFKGSLSLRRTMAFLSNPIPLSNDLLNKFLGNVDSDGSIFSKYHLLDDDGTPTRMRTHIPRHNINTFLAIADVSDHLQAMLMGRVDISQNHHYQHIAVAQRRKVASLMSMKKTSTELATPAQQSLGDTETPLQFVKRTECLMLSEKLNLTSNLKANLHTFDNNEEKAEFIEESFSDSLFEDIAAAFQEITATDSVQEASDMVRRHAILHPLKFGSCMRQVELWGCPYRMKCQSPMYCEHFTLTGRIDELPNISKKRQVLENSRMQLIDLAQASATYQKALQAVEESIQYVENLTVQCLNRAESRQLVSARTLLGGKPDVEGKIRTLAELFALEHKMLMKE